MIAGSMGVMVAPASLPWIALGCFVVIGMALGLVNTLMWSLEADTVAEFAAHRFEHRRHVTQIGSGVPLLLGRQRRAARGLVVVPGVVADRRGGAGSHAVHRVQAWHTRLDSDRPETLVEVLRR